MLWLREVNTGVINHLKSIFEDEPIKVMMYAPSKEVVHQEQYPYLTLQSLSIDENIHRTNINSIHIKDLGDKFSLEHSPTMHTFKYQVDIWCLTPQERDKYSMMLVYNSPKYQVVKFEDMRGEIGEYTVKSIPTFQMGETFESTNILYRFTQQYEVYIPIKNRPSSLGGKVLEIDTIINKTQGGN